MSTCISDEFWQQMIESLGYKTKRECFVDFIVYQEKSVNQIAETFGVSTETMRNKISNELGVKLKGPYRLNMKAQEMGFKDFKEALKYLMMDVWSMNDIGELFGHTVTSIKMYIKKFGYDDLVKPRGGRNLTLCTNQKWNIRANKLGFVTECEMLKSYEGKCTELYRKIVSVVRTEKNTKRLPRKQNLAARYRRCGLSPYETSNNS